MGFDDFISASRSELGFDEAASKKFEAMEALYVDWNSKINVISRKDIGNLYSHHVLHSLAIAVYAKRKKPELWEALSTGGMEVLDLGTGGGFPGIPLAVLFPATRFVLCDSIGKKLKVAGAVAEGLGIDNVRLVNGRAEDLKETFDVVVSRAVAPIEKLIPWVKGKYRDSIICLKGGPELPEEIAALSRQQKILCSKISTWQIRDWLTDEWYKGKFVVQIER